MILKAYQNQKKISEEDKQLNELIAKSYHTMGSYDYLTDKQLNEKYRKEYLGEKK